MSVKRAMSRWTRASTKDDHQRRMWEKKNYPLHNDVLLCERKAIANVGRNHPDYGKTVAEHNMNKEKRNGN